jgi:glycosyltransferase involved in cell wall biosynthesis
MVAHFYSAQRKDQITLCRAFIKVASELPNAHLILVGGTEAGGEEKYEQCVTICREAGLLHRVHFLGRRDDVAKIVNSLDIYVFSSLHEGLPIALIEAMLAKKPCVLSDIPPHLEVSSDCKYAEIFETQNADELSEKLLKLSLDKAFRDELAARAYDFASKTFSIESHIANLKGLYNSLLS